MSRGDGVDDLSDDLAQIKVGLELLGLTWESVRVQDWVERAGQVYQASYRERGERCPMPPPYPTLAWMPPELVRALALSLRKELGCGLAGTSKEFGGSG